MNIFVVAPFLVPYLKVGDLAAQYDELNEMSLIGLKVERDRGHYWITKGKMTLDDGQHRQRNFHNEQTCNGKHRQSTFYDVMTHIDLCTWLINHYIFRHEMDFWLFGFYKQKIIKQIKESLHWILAKDNLSSSINFQIGASLQTQNSLNDGSVGSPEKRCW